MEAAVFRNFRQGLGSPYCPLPSLQLEGYPMNLNLGAEDRTGVQDKAKTAHRQWRWHSRVHALSNYKEARSTVLGSSGLGASNASMNSKAFLPKAGANTHVKSQHSVPATLKELHYNVTRPAGRSTASKNPAGCAPMLTS